MIDFSTSTLTKDEHKTIQRIIDRLDRINGGHRVDRIGFSMDIDACHMVCPLDLVKLEGFDDANLLHDVLGINRHLNRETGELEDCFLPRCSK